MTDKDKKALWTIILIIAALAILDWLGISGRDLVESTRRLSTGDNKPLGWGVLAIVAFAVYKTINHITGK